MRHRPSASAQVSIRPHTSAYVSIRQHTEYLPMRHRPLASTNPHRVKLLAFRKEDSSPAAQFLYPSPAYVSIR